MTMTASRVRPRTELLLRFQVGDKKLLAQHHDREHILAVVMRRYPNAILISESSM